jgi:hypothetical protein
MLKRLLFTVIVLALALTPAINQAGISQAATKPHAFCAGQTTFTCQTLGTYNGQNVDFPTGTNGCTGPLVGVFGSSALKSYVLAAAADYCTAAAANHGGDKTQTPDVEYYVDPNSAGQTLSADSCPGVDYAADNSGVSNAIGVSDVFAPACAGSLARSASTIVDTNVGVNAVVAITQCPGATQPQGGAVHPLGSPVVCGGQAPQSASGCTVSGAEFSAPNNMSVSSANLLWSGNASDYSIVGGCSSSTGSGTTAPQLQQRSVGSGTRITWCDNIFGPGNDGSCANSTGAGTAGSTGTMVKDVCGNASNGAAALDPLGSIGYISRSAAVADPNKTSEALQNCGIVSLNGVSAYNQDCNPADSLGSPATYASFTGSNSGFNPESGAKICNGDLTVATNQYPAWGYEHFDLNKTAKTGGQDAAAIDFIDFITATNNSGDTVNYATTKGDEPQFLAQGFMRLCQMTVTRSADGGAPHPSASGATC